MLYQYVEYRILREGSTATYDTFLNVESSLDELVGMYACSVLNSAGQSNTKTLNIQGMLIYTITFLSSRLLIT